MIQLIPFIIMTDSFIHYGKFVHYNGKSVHYNEYDGYGRALCGLSHILLCLRK